MFQSLVVRARASLQLPGLPRPSRGPQKHPARSCGGDLQTCGLRVAGEARGASGLCLSLAHLTGLLVAAARTTGPAGERSEAKPPQGQKRRLKEGEMEFQTTPRLWPGKRTPPGFGRRGDKAAASFAPSGLARHSFPPTLARRSLTRLRRMKRHCACSRFFAYPALHVGRCKDGQASLLPGAEPEPMG